MALVALGDKDQITPREIALRGIFASFAAGEGQKDAQLVGAWMFWHYSSTPLSTESTRFLTLRPDGTSLWSNRSESGGNVRGRDSGGNETWTADYTGLGSGSDRGTWSAGNGKLYVIWENGSLSEWAYSLSGQLGSRKLLLKGKSATAA